MLGKLLIKDAYDDGLLCLAIGSVIEDVERKEVWMDIVGNDKQYLRVVGEDAEKLRSDLKEFVIELCMSDYVDKTSLHGVLEDEDDDDEDEDELDWD